MYLDGTQIKAFVEALSRAYPVNRFDQLLLGRLNKDRQNLSLQNDYITILYDVVRTANQEGWVMDLLAASRSSNPKNPQLIEFEELLEIGVAQVAEKVALEKIVNERSNFVDILQFREVLGSLETWVCAFEIPGSGGSGVLVQPDIVLTNYHVIEPILDGNVSPASVQCRFDYKALPQDNVINAGTAVGLAQNWDVFHSKYSKADTEADNDYWVSGELDFALVKLEFDVGNQPIGLNPEAGAPDRGWLNLPKNAPAMIQNDIVFVLQHPQDLNAATTKLQPMQLSSGIVMGFVGGGLRLRHDARTLPGSSGSPVFNSNLKAVALHHAGEPNSRLDYRGAYNQAIPLNEISRLLEEAEVHGVMFE